MLNAAARVRGLWGAPLVERATGPTARRALSAAFALVLAGCATVGPSGPAVKANGYKGPTLPEPEVATVFVLDGRPRYEAAFICSVDGEPLATSDGCASIVYLKPGEHVLAVKYRSTVEYGDGTYPIRVEAGRLYQVNATSFRTANRGVIRLIPMAPGAKLTYRNVAPNLVAAPKLDELIPYVSP